mmetsp:Transcript_50326/g.80393  ORF Transcript_50326/g.80393 Transcript_50326/m.80393 type:complete len:266 (+) Transcript_50326:3-800(+)
MLGDFPKAMVTRELGHAFQINEACSAFERDSVCIVLQIERGVMGQNPGVAAVLLGLPLLHAPLLQGLWGEHLRHDLVAIFMTLNHLDFAQAIPTLGGGGISAVHAIAVAHLIPRRFTQRNINEVDVLILGHGVRNTDFEGLCVLAASHPAKRILGSLVCGLCTMMAGDQGDACQLVPEICMQCTALDGQGLLSSLRNLHHQGLEDLLHIGPHRHGLVALNARPTFVASAVAAPVHSMLALQLPSLVHFCRLRLLCINFDQCFRCT